jgi:hypothetical protein
VTQITATHDATYATSAYRTDHPHLDSQILNGGDRADAPTPDTTV